MIDINTIHQGDCLDLMHEQWPIGQAKKAQWVSDMNDVREMYCRGWDIVCVYVRYWGVNTLMEIDEGKL